MIKKYFFVFLWFVSLEIHAKEDDVSLIFPDTPPIGNFSLHTIAVSPLISFGQTNIKKNLVEFGLGFYSLFSTQNYYLTGFLLELLWGITNRFTFEVFLPVLPKNRFGNSYSSGVGDLAFQLEGIIHTWGNPTHIFSSTLLVTVTAPTGSIHKYPYTGLGSTSFFVGGTLTYIDIVWYTFTSYGALFPLKGHSFQGGNQFLYQAGVGTNIKSNTHYQLAWMVEFDGTYSAKNKIDGTAHPNSGSNIIFVTPSLSFSLRKWSFQLGAGYPVIQSLNGDQPRRFLNAAFDVNYIPNA